jgi:prophage tail gpP-like protein
MPSESISLAIGGEAHAHWDSWSVESDLRTPADGFELALHTQDTARLSELLVAGSACTLSLGADRVLTGWIDEVIHEVSRAGVTIKVTGRDAAAILVDSTPPFICMHDAGLLEVVEQIARPLGITRVDIHNVDPKNSKRVQLAPTQKAWDAIKAVAETNNLWPWMEADGRLVIGVPDYSSAPADTLLLRLDGVGNNVSNLSVRRSYADRYSHVFVYGQHGQYTSENYDFAGNRVAAAFQDKTMVRYRPTTVEAPVQNQQHADQVARDQIANSRLEGLEIQAVVQGHRTAAGDLWTPGQRVIVRSEPHDLDATFFLMSRKLSLSRSSGPTTLLRLVEDKVWKSHSTLAAAYTGKATSVETFVEVKAAK